MKGKAYIKPSKPSLIVGLIVIVLMMGFGIYFMALIADESESGVGIVFLSVWLLVCMVIAGSMLYNYFKHDDDAAIGGEITFTDQETPTVTNNVENKLKQLERLYKEKLITEEEYQSKRKAIMESDW
jgi:hypothetical protein